MAWNARRGEADRVSLAVIVGSAFAEPVLDGRPLSPQPVSTSHGEVILYGFARGDGATAWVLPRHGFPHRLLPHQIPYRAHAAALAEVGCDALLVTSSVGVLDRQLSLDRPMIVADLLMPTNQLPDGTACTMFVAPDPGQGHLVLDEGLLDTSLSDQVARYAEGFGYPPPPRPIFAWSPGPRTKTAAENAMWQSLGAQVDSMTVAPEVVLANEQEIPVAALVVGHKYSLPGHRRRLDHDWIRSSLESGASIIERLAAAWLEGGEPVPFGNRIYRFESTP